MFCCSDRDKGRDKSKEKKNKHEKSYSRILEGLDSSDESKYSFSGLKLTDKNANLIP